MTLTPFTILVGASPISSGRNGRVDCVVCRVVSVVKFAFFQVAVPFRRRVIEPEVRIITRVC